MAEHEFAGRAFWSGVITFGLVSIPVDLFAASRRQHLRLRMLAPDGQPLRRVYYCTADERPLTSEDIVRGFEREKGEFVVVTDEELEAVAPEKTRDIDLRRFVERLEVPPMFFERAYFLAPAGQSSKAYHLLATGMERSGRAGVATFVMRDKEYLVAIISERGVLRAETLRFAEDLRSPEDIGLPAKEPVDRKLLGKYVKAIRAAAADALDPAELEDVDEQRLRELVESKRARGVDVVEVATAANEDEEGETVDLMAVLKQRLGLPLEPAAASGADSAGRAAPAGRRRGRRSSAPPAARKQRARNPRASKPAPGSERARPARAARRKPSTRAGSKRPPRPPRK